MKTYIEDLEERTEELQEANTQMLEFINTQMEFHCQIRKEGRQLTFLYSYKGSPNTPKELATATRTQVDGKEAWFLFFGNEHGYADAKETIDDIVAIVKRKLNLVFATFITFDGVAQFKGDDYPDSSTVYAPYVPVQFTNKI